MDYWQSIADALTALLLAVLLVVAILILVIASSSGWFDGAFHNGAGKVSVHDVNGGRWDDGSGGDDDDAGDHRGRGPWESNESAGSGGGAGDWDDPDPGKGEWDDPIRAAVHVTVVDAETDKVIAEEGTTFELVAGGAVQTLHSFYPEKVEYKQFQTTKDGTFYLPQKIAAGTWYLVGKTAPTGYDPAERVKFTITKEHDWNNPYELKVGLYPCRNTVRVQQTDALDGSDVAGGKWNVIAVGDISTADGTLRYHADEVADVIKINKHGYGVSKELYLGSFRLEQVEYPKGYAAYRGEPAGSDVASGAGGDESKDALAIQVEQKATVTDSQASNGDSKATEAQSPLHAFMMQKTRYTVRLTDDETGNPIEGAEFVLNPGDVHLKTDAQGSASFVGLDKSTDYVIHQASVREGFRAAEDISFTVDVKGLIDGSPSQDVIVSNYIVRVNVSAVGMILRKPMAGIHLNLQADDGSSVLEWNSKSSGQMFEGLAPGDYQLVGPDGSRAVHVEDTAGVQKVQYSILTAFDILAVCGAILVIGVIAGLTWRTRRKEA